MKAPTPKQMAMIRGLGLPGVPTTAFCAAAIITDEIAYGSQLDPESEEYRTFCRNLNQAVRDVKALGKDTQ